MIIEVPPIEKIRKHQTRVPVDVNAIATDLNILVSYGSLQQGVSAELARAPQIALNEWKITILEGMPRETARYLVSFLVAHYVLHRNKVEWSGRLTVSSMLKTTLGLEADLRAVHLALWILMPDDLLKQLLSLGLTTNEALAETFAVAESLVRIRLARLEGQR